MSGEPDITQIEIINVVHECADGFHEFVSQQIPGLYIAVEQHDLKAAFDDIPHVIEELIFADYGIKVAVKHQQEYSEYLKTLPESHQPKIYNYRIELLKAA
jgi:hypothetical protein